MSFFCVIIILGLSAYSLALEVLLVEQRAPIMPSVESAYPAQEFVDLVGSPIVMVSDDFLVDRNLYDNCTLWSVSIDVLRRNYSMDPSNVIIGLWTDDAFGHGPDELIFQYIFSSPTNNWQTPTGVARGSAFYQSLEFLFDNDVSYHFNVSLTLGPGRYWLSYYAQLPVDHNANLGIENRFYVLASPFLPTLATDRRGYMRDTENLMRHGWTNWTDLADVEIYLHTTTKSKNLAMSIVADCRPNNSSVCTDCRNESGLNNNNFIVITITVPIVTFLVFVLLMVIGCFHRRVPCDNAPKELDGELAVDQSGLAARVEQHWKNFKDKLTANQQHPIKYVTDECGVDAYEFDESAQGTDSSEEDSEFSMIRM
jgi:hypothetical protein